MKKDYLLIMLCCCLTANLMAQRTKSRQAIPDYQQTAIRVSYFGENIFHSGFKVGLEYPIKAMETIKVKRKGKIKRRGLALITATNLGLYRHKKNHTGLFLNGEIGGRFITNKSKKIELSLGLGYIHAFLDGETFTVDDNGTVTSKGITSQGGFMPSIIVGWGRDLYWKKKSRWAWHVRGQYFFQMPYNVAFLIRSAIEFGLSYRIDWKSNRS